MAINLETLYQITNFNPNQNQEKAIRHLDGPLFLVAGPGSGKTKVLLWRSLNLIVFHGVKPEEIFLGTFTEKAAKQLKEGLLSLLGIVTNETGQPYDISQMYVGTIHSLCQRFMTDRRFAQMGRRMRPPALLDELDQYFHLHNNRFWNNAKASLDLPEDIFQQINQYMSGRNSQSKHKAVENCIRLFNRFSEENLDVSMIEQSDCDDELKYMAQIYRSYLDSLKADNRCYVDFSLLQQEGHRILQENPASSEIFKHVIIDEYQDTNFIQEKIFFRLAAGHGNICVVGDDDQALYRFRGATVENFVCFPDRCNTYLSRAVTKIPLSTNYRSRKKVVDFFSHFITQENWSKDGRAESFYRIVDKNIHAHSTDEFPSVVASMPDRSDAVCDEIAEFVAQLIAQEKVVDPNQIAFLYPSLKSVHVQRMIAALDRRGIKVYAPRANSFLDNPEPTAIFGLFLKIFGKPTRDPRYDIGDNRDFNNWIDICEDVADDLMHIDQNLETYIDEKMDEVKVVVEDYNILVQLMLAQGWQLTDEYDPQKHKRVLNNASGLSSRAKKDLGSKGLEYAFKKRLEQGISAPLRWVLGRATSLDWNILDLFYRFCGFTYFKEMFDLAEDGTDEGPICNLALTSQYLARFVDNYYGIVGGFSLKDDKFMRVLFNLFLGALFRKGETEYEDAEETFPKGRIPFLTIHQAKGLEFPIVVLGNLARGQTRPQRTEELVRPFLIGEYEPLDRVASFDTMRMFYVALSRAKNLLILAHLTGPGVSMHPCFRSLLGVGNIPRLPKFDLSTLPNSDEENKDLCRVYSYTSDYLSYQDCPRRYMVFRKYGFAPSRSTTMFFGSLVHQTLEDLHHRLIQTRRDNS